MFRHVDLSYTIESSIPVHPYDEPLRLSRNKFLDKDKFNDSRLETGMHVGTHIDVPSHLTDSNILISDYRLDKFVGDGCLIDVRGEDIIKFKSEYQEKIKENMIVLFYTGYSLYTNTKEYFNSHPIIDESLADFSISRNVKMVGVDMPSVDRYPFKIHKMLFRNDILIIENLTNLKSLINVNNFQIIDFPLKIKAEASLVRVVAKI